MVTEPASRLRLLIACGDSDTRLHLQRVLHDAYEVHVVGDGEAALAAIRESLPDLLLAHVILPPLDGIDLLHALRADPRTRDIPAILVSDSANEDSRLDALKARAADYLVKPFSPAELLARIDARLEIARLRRELSESAARRPPDEVAVTDLARKNRRLRRERNALQRDLAKRTEEVSRLTQELTVGGETMLTVKREFNDELTAIMRLHDLSGRLLDHTAIEPLLEEVLEASIALLNADLGNVQLYDPKSQTLKIVAQRGFNQDLLNYFDNVQEGTGSSGAALERCERVIVEDVLTEPLLAEQLAIIDAAGFRAFQSTPLISRGGEMLGVISTHFRQPHRPSARELRFVDLYAAQAAEIIERKQAEEALRVSEERFRRYFELGLIGMAMTSPSKGILEVNDELCRVLGYERDELLQKSWAEITHPDDLAADVAQFDRVIAGEINGYTLDKRWIRKDGQIIDSIMSAQCMRDAEGSVHYFVGLVLDTTERTRGEQKLRRSEAYLAEAQRLSHTANWAWNVSTGESYWSAELFRIYGMDPDDVIPGYPAVLVYIHPEDRSRVQEIFENAVREEIGYELAYRVVWSDGTIRHVNNLAHPVFSEAGDLIEYVGTTIDTTERIYAEEKLRRSEANLAEGQKISHTGSWAWNASSGKIFTSQELLRIFGLDAEPSTPTRERFFAAIHPDDRERVRQAFEEATHSTNDYEAEYRVVRADGTIRHIKNLSHPVFNESNTLVEYVGMVIDITERREAEELVRQAHERIELLLDSISDNFFGLDRDGRFTYFNKHAAKQMQILGKDPEHLIGKVAWEEFPDMPNKANVQRVLSERVPITDELYYASLGEWVENHMYPSHDGGLVVFQRYITARKRTEEELRKAQAELAHATGMTTIDELAASIAHEINQPLGAIVNNSNVAIHLASTPESRRELVETLSDIVNDASRASAMIARIRALARKAIPDKASLQLKEVVSDVLVLAQRELAERRIAVRNELPEDLPRSRGDRLQIQQVLLNLIMNASDAMSDVEDHRRILTIRGEPSELNAKPAVLITVSDLGIGFKVEDRERMFEAFYSTRPNGLGMGLRISRSIVEAHGGRLWAQPNEDMGATLFLSLPAESPETL